MFFLQKSNKIKKISLIIGGKKGILSPHLNYWGRVPGLPPESTPMPFGGDLYQISGNKSQSPMSHIKS